MILFAFKQSHDSKWLGSDCLMASDPISKTVYILQRKLTTNLSKIILNVWFLLVLPLRGIEGSFTNVRTIIKLIELKYLLIMVKL